MHRYGRSPFHFSSPVKPWQKELLLLSKRKGRIKKTRTTTTAVPLLRWYFWKSPKIIHSCAENCHFSLCGAGNDEGQANFRCQSRGKSTVGIGDVLDLKVPRELPQYREGLKIPESSGKARWILGQFFVAYLKEEAKICEKRFSQNCTESNLKIKITAGRWRWRALPLEARRTLFFWHCCKVL